MKFRMKPGVLGERFRHLNSDVIAHRIGDDGWPDEIWEGVMRNEIILYLDRGPMKDVRGHVVVETLEGKMRAAVGDYVMAGARGDFFPMNGKFFEATYEPAE